MTEKMAYKHSEVLGAVLTNRACHTLAVYFLLNKKMKRLSKEYREMRFQEEKKGDKAKNEYFQTQWRKHVDKLTIPPKQAPVYLAVSKGPGKEKKHRSGLLRALTGGHRNSPLAPPGTVASSSMEYLEIQPLFSSHTPPQRRRLATMPPVNVGSPERGVPAPRPRPSACTRSARCPRPSGRTRRPPRPGTS
ncbi:hormonally up-regulated neu tumor-associated kinase homolog [Hippocampus comes]|uniref:hormonally up-regulated neu tumor-associated kinase homolog n=1 Tax=Hippocampus comes TaxID=109280 RepID=UPI00094E9B30|nr:PREDICTED: hormonally up-regulated neu tumor-associated kinase homolog [Hippocampus comes]